MRAEKRVDGSLKDPYPFLQAVSRVKDDKFIVFQTHVKYVEYDILD